MSQSLEVKITAKEYHKYAVLSKATSSILLVLILDYDVFKYSREDFQVEVRKAGLEDKIRCIIFSMERHTTFKYKLGNKTIINFIITHSIVNPTIYNVARPYSCYISNALED